MRINKNLLQNSHPKNFKITRLFYPRNNIWNWNHFKQELKLQAKLCED
jgi:hypothetical protein